VKGLSSGPHHQWPVTFKQRFSLGVMAEELRASVQNLHFRSNGGRLTQNFR